MELIKKGVQGKILLATLSPFYSFPSFIPTQCPLLFLCVCVCVHSVHFSPAFLFANTSKYYYKAYFTFPSLSVYTHYSILNWSLFYLICLVDLPISTYRKFSRSFYLFCFKLEQNSREFSFQFLRFLRTVVTVTLVRIITSMGFCSLVFCFCFVLCFVLFILNLEGCLFALEGQGYMSELLWNSCWKCLFPEIRDLHKMQFRWQTSQLWLVHTILISALDFPKSA